MKQLTKRGRHGTLYLYRIEYRNEHDPDSPIFAHRCWAYDLEHAEMQFYSGDSEGWEIVSIKRAAL
jgi:hypothetical protein